MRSVRRPLVVLGALAAFLCGEAAAQEILSLDVEQALEHPELLRVSSVLRPRAGDVRITNGAVEPGAVLLSIPVAHRRTAIVNQDVGEGLGILVSPRVLLNGARGYWSGNFSAYAGGQGEAAWCFLDERQARTRSLCFVPRINAKAPASWSQNLYLARQLTVTTEVDNQWDTPLVSEQPVSIHADLRLEYVFDGWRGRDAQIEVRIGGNEFETLRLSVFEDRTTLPTAAGTIVITRPEPRARGSVVSLTPIVSAMPIERPMLQFADPNLRPIPVVRAVGSIQPDEAARDVAPGTDLFAQDVVPAAAYALSQRPYGVDERAERGLGPLSPFRVNGHDVLCSLERIPESVTASQYRLANGRRVVANWDFCVEDADGEEGYEAKRGYPGYPTGSNIGIWWTTGPGPMPEPVTAEEMDFAWPVETIHLRYVTSDDERRTADGIRPRRAVFALVLGEPNRLQPDWWLLPVQLDNEGRGEVRLGGRLIALVEQVTLDGVARVRVLAGLPEDAAPLLNPADFAR